MCSHKGHLARNCLGTQPKQESPDRSDNPKEASIMMTGAESELTEAQLKEMLARCKLRNEQEHFEDAYTNTRTVTTESNKNVIQVVVPTLFLDMEIEGVPVEAVVDGGSPVTIISRSILHKIARSL